MKSLLLCITLGAVALSAVAAPAQETPPTPTLEQRVAGLEAYLQNSDPRAPLQNAQGEIPPGLTTPAVGIPGPGHNAWIMVCAALVLFMTLPGLALFYGGLVRRKNVLSILAQCLGITGLVTLLWWACGYSLIFSSRTPLLGGLDYAFFTGVTSAPNPGVSLWVSHNVFAIFQLMFAIITPALMIGAVAERMRFRAVMAFVALWMFLVYFPLAHMIWGADGWMNGMWNPHAAIRAIDFAGGTVVHMSSGWSALVLCILLGKRMGYGKESFAPHNLVLCMVGTGMLWVGWYGFNAGSAGAADGIASNAFVTTTLATAIASATWGLAEMLTRGKATVLGFCSGIVGGLVTITPAAGFVTATGAVIIGVVGGLVPFFAVMKLKHWLGYDDALDTFGVHAVGGTVGALLTGILASREANPGLDQNLSALVGGTLWLEQLKAIGITLLLSIGVTVALTFALRSVMSLRPTPEEETAGLDLCEHGEEGYIL